VITLEKAVERGKNLGHIFWQQNSPGLQTIAITIKHWIKRSSNIFVQGMQRTGTLKLSWVKGKR
jgi:hypothetical protein